MKTHELAKALSRLASILRAGPNVELDQLYEIGGRTAPSRKGDRVGALSILSDLSRIDKQEWINLIDELELPISYRERDAARDLMGKIMTLLERDPNLRRSLRNRIVHRTEPMSSELLDVFKVLLDE